MHAANTVAMSAAQVLSSAPPTAGPVLSVVTQAVQSQSPNLTIKTQPPVNQDGAFLRDKVFKSGWLLKRTRKTKGWKRRWFVLRADRLSCYKDQKEYKIHRQIHLCDVTAVAALKDAKQPFSFGVFSNSKNFHFRAESEEETKDWTDKIWTAVGKQVPEESMMLSSPVHSVLANFPGKRSSDTGHARVFSGGRTSLQTLDYSGPDVGSVSSLSDAARVSQLSLNYLSGNETAEARPTADPPRMTRNGSGLSSTEQLPKVIWHGYLYCLKSKGGVRQWKKYWTVVRNVNIGFYKNEEEYRAIKILPLDSIIDAVEIDPLSKSKKHCLQVITEAKAYRFCAPDEDALVKVLGAMKSTLARNKAPNHNSASIPAVMQ
ncbi:hypothetical protein FN846DRAFT_967040 [Sphaerosporella brunnea]|uniref:PH domain-containing protein n=1 Tax=Sphaerosporella brunnea TaxID=1250544 RepID=A0A5J5ELQ7_9PEZI|nr:hypothetical protein FN846DRAFT_967040 [Sphaerosporella brunnea]